MATLESILAGSRCHVKVSATGTQPTTKGTKIEPIFEVRGKLRCAPWPSERRGSNFHGIATSRVRSPACRSKQGPANPAFWLLKSLHAARHWRR